MIQGPNPFPEGTVEHWKTSQSRRRGTNPIPRWSGHLTREVIPESTHVGEKKLHSEHFIVPGALNFLKVLGALSFPKVLGALDFLKVPGALMSCSTTGHSVGSGQVRKAFHFSVLLPHS